MDKNVSLLESIPPESLRLTLTNEPFFQKQHRDFWSIESMKFSDYDFIICTGGSARFYLDNSSVTMTEGSVLVIPPGTTFSAEHLGENYFMAVAQHFILKVFGDLDFFKMIEYENFLYFKDWDHIKNVLDQYRVLTSKKIRKFEQHALFNIILNNFIYDGYKNSKVEKSEHYAFIFQMLEYIEKNFNNESVLKEALNFSTYSRDYTSRKFRKVVGLSPKQYIIKTRLNYSRTLLLQNRSVKETAFRSGFRDELYFSRLFKKYIHQSPKEFKIQNI